MSDSGPVRVALLPGDDQPDAELASLSNLPAEALHRLWQYCVHGGPENARNLLAFLTPLIDDGELRFDWDDELLAATVLTRDGAVVHPRFRSPPSGAAAGNG